MGSEVLIKSVEKNHHWHFIRYHKNNKYDILSNEDIKHPLIINLCKKESKNDDYGSVHIIDYDDYTEANCMIIKKNHNINEYILTRNFKALFGVIEKLSVTPNCILVRCNGIATKDRKNMCYILDSILLDFGLYNTIEIFIEL